MKPAKIAVAVLLLGGATVAWTVRVDPPRFPHARHAKLFPTCTGCHAGITTGDSTTMFPPASLCARCHDGSKEKAVSWTGPALLVTNVSFSHTEHVRLAAKAGDTSVTCANCHALPDTTRGWMAVGAARGALCVQCHAHGATAHLADDNRCATCHVPLAQARTLPESTIAAFPKPPSHDAPDFLTKHAPATAGAEAQCATCHARESCERCHVNAASLAPVQRLAPDARVAALVAGRTPSYPTPASHRDAAWAYDHGGTANREIASCANCHAQSSCTTCHVGRGGMKVIAKLPRPPSGKAQGVLLERAEPVEPPPSAGVRAAAQQVGGGGGAAQPHIVRVHAVGFATMHGTVAAAGQLTCSSCHTQGFCASCHAGEGGESGRHRFHPANFLSRHSVEAYGRENDCARCHNPEAFCRTCHLNVGVGVRAARNAAYHTGQPLWLLQHGQAARQALESCASCHQQRDCLRCHSTLGQGVNPHGPGFDAQRMASRNRQVCLRCHLGDPLATPNP